MVVFRDHILKTLAFGVLTCMKNDFTKVGFISETYFINKNYIFKVWNVNLRFQ